MARRTSGTLTERLDELQARVRVAEDKVEAYRREKNIVDANGKRVNEDELAGANAQFIPRPARVLPMPRRAGPDRQHWLLAIAGGNLPEAVNSPTLGNLRQQLGDAERRAATLATTLGERHPDYVSARAALRDFPAGGRG